MSVWGENLKIFVFGESHGPAVGIVVEGMKSGLKIDMDDVNRKMCKRSPGGAYATPRKEADAVKILSGIYNGYTQGTPIAAVIENTNTKSSDYETLKNKLRPSHADYAAAVKYGGFADMRGGGHFSGRLTAPLVFAGALCAQALAREGVQVAARLYMAGGVYDTDMPYSKETAERLYQKDFPVYSDEAAEGMKTAIEKARSEGDSIGGIAECFAIGLKNGLGGPLFEGVESRISSILFGIPGVKGMEFGGGFSLSAMCGSEANDTYMIADNGSIITKTNHSGGILGGITTGMPLVVRAAFKPTPSIALMQDTVDLQAKTNTKISIQGRHDPCIALRGVYAVEACVAIALMDLMMEA